MPDSVTPSVVREISEGLAQRYLGAYVDALNDPSAPRRGRKEINDAVWGTIALTPIEVVILDSPLLQRLRFIRQLGAVHWVYPNATHTRFEHTLGVLFQMQQLLAGLNTAAAAERTGDAPLIGESDAQMLRICALLHDIGHLAFSHVSEHALDALPEFATLSRAFSEELEAFGRGEDRQFSEIVAYYIVRSPAMREFFTVLVAQYDPPLNFESSQARNIDAIVEKISRALIGRKIDDTRPLLHELISGPYDADKLDYLVRDARCAGIPSILDIRRLVQKLAVRPLLAEELPQDIAGQVELEAREEAWLFGIKRSGIGILDELQLARMLAYAKIYRHPKVVVVEQMVHAFVHAIGSMVTTRRLLELLYTQSDDSILALDRQSMINQLGLDAALLESSFDRLLGIAEHILRSIKERRLWVRAFQFSNASVEEQEERVGWDLMNEMLDHPQKREAFLTLVRGEVSEALHRCNTNPMPTREVLDSSITLRAFKSVAGETQIGRAYLLQNREPPRPFSAHLKARGSWVDQYMGDQAKAYIVSPPEYADWVFVATEKLLFKDYGVKLPEWVKELSKRDTGVLLSLQRRLRRHGYWEGLPHYIRPGPERLEKPDVRRRIVAFDQRRSSFQEPPGEHSKIRDRERTRAWLRQFESDEDADCALILLDHFKILTRADTGRLFAAFMEERPEFRDAWVVPFGSAKDSGAIQGYFAADQTPALGTLSEYLVAGEGRPLIFVDDFIGSGSQAKDILAAWFGRDDLRSDLAEERSALDSATQDRLMALRSVAFVFVAGWSAGIAQVKGIITALGLNAIVHCHIREDAIPFAREVLTANASPQRAEAFLNRCTSIGEELIRAQPGRAPDAEKVRSRALGYGNRGMLLSSPVNVPAQTLTAIWAAGRVEGADWLPLLARRKKQ